MAADGSIVVVTDIDDKQAQVELNRLAKKIDGLNEKIKQSQNARMPLLEQSEQLAVQLDVAKAKLAEMQAASAGTYSAQQITGQKETVKSLQAQWNAVQRQVEGYDRSIAKSTADLEAAEVKAGELSAQLAIAGESGAKAWKKTTDGAKKAETSFEKLRNRIAGIAKQVFVFSVLSSALGGLRRWLSSAVQSNEQAAEAVARLKGALLTLAQPLLEVVIPAFVTFVNILTAIVTKIASLVSGLFGKTLQQSKDAAKGLYGEQKALKGVGSAAKKAEKNLASFDEVQKLSNDGNDSSSFGGGTGGGGVGTDFNSIVADSLDSIAELLIGAALVALGAILLFTGANILLGLGMIIAGAAMVWDAATDDSGAVAKWIQEHTKEVTTALLISGSVALVLGILLLFTHHILIGIGLIIAGIALFASEAAINKDGISKWIKNHMEEIANILVEVSVIAFVIGVLMLIVGNVLIGIGLILTGIALFASAAGLGEGKNLENFIKTHMQTIADTLMVFAAFALVVGVVLLLCSQIAAGIGAIILGVSLFATGAANSANLSKWIQEHLEEVTGVLVGLSVVAFVLGVVLLISGHILIGIGALLLGIGLLASAIALNSDSVSQWIEQNINKIYGVVAGLSAALLVIGILLCFVNLPLGISLILLGAVGLFPVAAMNWDAILNKLKEVWDKIKEWFDTNVKPKLTLSYWQEKFSTIGEALKQKIKDGINAAIALFNKFIDFVNDKLNISWGSVSLFGAEVIPSGSFQLLTIPHIPALAQGAVIPPNREFLAVLGDQKQGTNVEAPLATIEQAFRNVMAEQGNSRSITIVMEIDRREFGRAVYRFGNEEAQRVGVKLGGVD